MNEIKKRKHLHTTLIYEGKQCDHKYKKSYKRLQTFNEYSNHTFSNFTSLHFSLETFSTISTFRKTNKSIILVYFFFGAAALIINMRVFKYIFIYI